MSKPADLQDAYRALDLKPGASLADVEKARRDLTKVWQPDRFGNDRAMRQKAKDKLRQINKAYERLCQELGGKADEAAEAEDDEADDADNATKAAVDNAAKAPAKLGDTTPSGSKWDPRWLLAFTAIVLALSFLGVDSWVRFKGISEVSKPFTVNEPDPAPDPKSRTGFYENQHEQVMPALGTDGYHWVMQTELMLDGEAGLRVRHVDYDGLPGGRDIHWSSSLHWADAILAWFDHMITGVPMVAAVEREMSWANTFILLLCMVLVPLCTARRFGWAPTALLAVCFVTVYPYYEFSFVGYFDHHGLAATSDMLMVLFLVGAGGGWLRNQDARVDRLSELETDVWSWLPDKKQSRRWAMASAIAGGTGLWISTASVVPCMFGVGVAAVVGTGLLTIKMGKKSPWRADPTLWRYWGVAGALTSLFYYLLEYFPGYISTFSAVIILLIGAILLAMFGKGPLKIAGLGLTGLFVLVAIGLLIGVPALRTFRLEVNHPLYALAWLGAGDFICRICQICQPVEEDAPPRTSEFWLNWSAALVGNLLMLFAILFCVLALGEQVFVIQPGKFLMILHEDYILEFRTFVKQVSFLSAVQVVSGISAVPLVSFPMLVLLFMPEVKRPMKAVLLTAFLPAAVMLLLAFRQVRWLGIDCAVSIAALTATILVMTHIWPKLPLARITLITGGVLLLSAGLFVGFYHSNYDNAKWISATAVYLAMVFVMVFMRRQWYEIVAVLGLSLAIFLASYQLVWLYFPNALAVSAIAGLFLMLLLVCLESAWRKIALVLVVTLTWAFVGACCSFMYPGMQKFLVDDVFLTQDQMLTPNKFWAVVYAFVIVGKVLVLFSAPAFVVGLAGLLLFRWRVTEAIQAVFVGLMLFFIMLVTAIYPLTTLFQWELLDFNSPTSNLDITQLATRDVSHRLRLRLGDEQGVILSGPTTTTWMMYFGGFRGVGNLYWENVAGLRATAKVYSVDDNRDDFKAAQDQIKQLGITHIAIFSWDPFALEYARLGAEPPIRFDPQHQNDAPNGAFIIQLFFGHRIPLWLRPLPYHLPDHPDLKGHNVNLFEVVPKQTVEDYVLHIAEWVMASGAPESMNQAEQYLTQGLTMKPDYLPLLIDLALVQQSSGENEMFKSTMDNIGKHLDQVSSLTLESRVNLAMDYYQLNAVNKGSDLSKCAEQIDGCIAMYNNKSHEPDDNSLRHLPVERMENFLQLIVDVYRDRPMPKIYDELMAYISPGLQAQIFNERALLANSAGNYAQAADFERQAIKLMPEYDMALRTLAIVLSTAPDASVRNGKEAVAAAEKLSSIVRGQGWDTLDLLACAYAEDGKFDDAVFYESTAMQLASNTNKTDTVSELSNRLTLFLAHQPYHKP